MRRSARSLVVAALLVTGSLLGWAAVDAGCNTYPDSRPEYHDGELVCAGSGSGCTECTNGGGSCITNGGRCTPLQDY